MNVLKRNNENNDRFIVQRSDESNTINYFQIKEQLEEAESKDDKMMVDTYDEVRSNQKAYNALLQSEILDIEDPANFSSGESSNENIPTSMT
jgi:hypothetical protein